MSADKRNIKQGPDAAKASCPCFNLKTILKGLQVALCVTVVYVVAEWAGDKVEWLSPWGKAIKSYNLTDFYFWAHNRKESISHNGVSVVTVDISSCHSRKEVAEVINRINSAQPLVVGLDVIFPQVTSMDQAENDSLVAACSRIKNLVLAREYRPVSGTGHKIESSFFAKDINAREGAVSLPAGTIREWSPLLVYGNDTIPSFTKVIAEIADIPMPSVTTPILIDYSICDTLTLRADQQWNPDYLEGQIVLVGDLKDLRDSHNIPISLNITTKEAGVNIHRKILHTAMHGKPIYRVPKWLMMLISSLLLWVFAVVVAAYAHRWEKNSDGYIEARKLRGFLRGWIYSHAFGLAQVTLIIFSVIGGYMLFWTIGVAFEIKFLLCGFALLYGGWRFVEKAPARRLRRKAFIKLIATKIK